MDTAERLHSYLIGPEGRGVLAAYVLGPLSGEDAPAVGPDVEVALLLDGPSFPGRVDRGDEAERQGEELAEILRQEHVGVVVLNDLPPDDARELIKRGRRFLVRGDQEVRGFERDILLRAGRVEPFVLRARRRLLEILKE